MKKIVALLLTLVFTLSCVAALAAAPNLRCPGCGVGYDFSCDCHGIDYGSPRFRLVHYPAVCDLTGTMEFSVKVNTEQALYKQVVTQGLRGVFGPVVGDATHMWEVFDFNTSIKSVDQLAAIDTLAVDLRSQQAPKMYRPYRAIISLEDEWVEIPVKVEGANIVMRCKCDPCTCSSCPLPANKLLAYYQVELTAAQLEMMDGGNTQIIIISK